MAVSRCRTFTLLGLEALTVTVEVDIAPADKPTLVIVGLPDSAVKESKDRVLTALKNVGYPLGSQHCTVNLAPGHLRKEGACYDLPIALGIVLAMEKINSGIQLDNYFIAGELSLSGELRPIAGALSLAMLAQKHKAQGLLIPLENAPEASVTTKLNIYPFTNLKEAIAFLINPKNYQPYLLKNSSQQHQNHIPPVDLQTVRGQYAAKRALEITAAGGHNLIFSGPPGSGKSLLAKALISLLPPLTLQEALESTKIHSIARMLPTDTNLLYHRPFRAPHHTISYAGLVGGGNIPRPGEISLAHNGILFLDELPEFSRSVLEVLRQPLEDRLVTISRARQQVTYPCSILCIAAMNPCPCGYTGHPTKACKDTDIQKQRYLQKISGPLWDRFDLFLTVPPVSYQEMHQAPTGETSATVRQRVIQARERQYARYGEGKTNAMLTRSQLDSHCKLDTESHAILKQAMEEMHLSARAADRILRVGLTIADLANSPLCPEHLMEALSYRKATT